MESKRTLYLTLLLLVALVVIGGLVFVLKPQQQPLPPAQELAYTPAKTLEVRHKMEGGVNTYQGEISLSSCAALSTSISTVGADPVKLTLALRVLGGSVACADSGESMQPFSVSFAPADGSQPVFEKLTINGESADFVLVEE